MLSKELLEKILANKDSHKVPFGCQSTMIHVFEDNTNTLSSDTEKLKIGLSDEVTDTFMKRFDDIEKRLEEFISKSANKSTTMTKKDGDLDV